MSDKQLGAVRKEYGISALHEEDVHSDPIMQFELWFRQALEREGEEANAAALSTLGLDGYPAGRIVLLKFYSADGFAFYTNYNSNKGQELAACPRAALTFYWRTLERQVRLHGRVSKVEPLISDDYFESRPRASRIGAWASPQSEEVDSREALEASEARIKERFEGQEHIPRPPHWGGYLIDPVRIEFWQGRASRLHDRIVYDKSGESWKIRRLAP